MVFWFLESDDVKDAHPRPRMRELERPRRAWKRAKSGDCESKGARRQIFPTERATNTPFTPPPTAELSPMSIKEGDLDGDVQFHNGPSYPSGGFSEMFFWPMGAFLTKSYRRRLTHEDTFKLRLPHTSEALWAAFEPIWERECAKKNPVLVRALLRLFAWELVQIFIMLLSWSGLAYTNPLLLPYLAQYFVFPYLQLYRGFVYVGAIFLASMCAIILFNALQYKAWAVGMCVRSILINLIYRKSLRISPSFLGSRGAVLNLMAADAQIIVDTFSNFVLGAVSPFQIAVTLVLLSREIGKFALIPLGLLIITFPFLGFIGGRLPGVALKVLQAADHRIKLTTEFISAIRIVKYYAWEKPFLKKIDEAREQELVHLNSSVWLQAWLVAALFYLPTLALGLTIFFYAIGHTLGLGSVFSAIAYLSYLRFPLVFMPVALTFGVQYVVSLKRIQDFALSPDLKQQSLVDKDENGQGGMLIFGDASFTWETDQAKIPTANVVLKDINVTVGKGKLVMVVGPVGSGKSSLVSAFLKELTVTSGQVWVSAPIGYASQEPFLINTTIRDNITFGQSYDPLWYQHVVNACALATDFSLFPAGDLTEVAEKGSNLSGGQRQRVNVARAMYSNRDIFIFDDPFSAVDAHVGDHMFNNICIPLRQQQRTILLITNQLQFLPFADQVVVLQSGHVAQDGPYDELIADKSGALYGLAREYGLVTEVEKSGKRGREGLRQSVRMSSVATWQRSTFSPIQLNNIAKVINNRDNPSSFQRPVPPTPASQVVLAQSRNRSGSKQAKKESAESPPTQRGRGSKTLRREDTRRLLEQIERGEVTGDGDAPAIPSNDPNLSVDNLTEEEIAKRDEKNRALGALITKEATSSKAVSNAVYAFYFLAGGIFTWLLIILFNCLRTGFSVGQSVWLSRWANPAKANEFNKATHLGAYIALVAGEVITIIAFVFIMTRFAISSSRNVHRRLLKSIAHATSGFFDKTPLGRLLSRFSKDMTLIDTLLSMQLQQTVNMVFMTLAVIVNLMIASGYAAVVMAVAFLYFIIMTLFFRRTSSQIQRLEAVSRAPIFTHFGETLEGLQTVRAYNMSENFIVAIMNKVDYNACDYLALGRLGQWFNAATNHIVNLIVTGLFLMFLLFRNYATKSFDVPLAISACANSIALVSMLGATSTIYADYEARMNAPERVYAYKDVPQENPYEIEATKPPAEWPATGEIDFDNLTIAYKPGVPVLHSLSAKIRPKEKIGIVGRTGAGKSTLITALFRTTEPAGGRVLIDGVDIDTLGLYDLRRRISIIPQVPQLFIGTVRYNLDPFEEHTDEEIWRVLEMVSLKSFVSSLGQNDENVIADGEEVKEQGRGLLAQVEENGSNFSVGQRQLISIARCLLLDSKILLLDEATASLDVKSDSLLQRMIRTHFVEKTVLTIAHRLITVIDSDRIMVLDAGKIVEFDSPKKLLENRKGVFYAMVHANGVATAKHLTDIANGKARVADIFDEDADVLEVLEEAA